MLALLSCLKGYLTITVYGTFCERFLNVCATKNILLWDIKRISEKMLRCKISVPAFKRLLPITYHTGVRVHIISRHGLPFWLQKYRKRKILLFSLLIAVIFMIVANQFVWVIEIRGNENVKTVDILEALEAEGLKKGMPKSKIDQQLLKNRMLIRLPALAWLWADKRGSKIIVEVRERIPVPEIFNPDDYCNIVAAKDGIIDALLVKGGIPVVSEGDTVLTDTVLVTGKITSELKPDIRYVQAEAQVFARVWYKKTEQFSRITTETTETGKEKKHFTLTLFGKEIPLYAKKEPFADYDLKTNTHELSLFGNYLGITLTTDIYTEVIRTEKLQTAESVAAAGAQALKEQIDKETAPAASFITASDTFREIDETTVEVTVQAEYRENIAKKVSGGNLTPPQPEVDTEEGS